MRSFAKSSKLFWPAVLMVIGLLASVVAWIEVRPQSHLLKFGYVWSNALQVASPEYQITFRGNVQRNFLSVDVAVAVDSHSTPTAPGETEGVVEISEDWLGRIDFGKLPESAMTGYLETFGGGGGEDSQAKAEAVAEAKTLEQDEFATVLVELAAPMPEADVEEVFGLSDAGLKRFFLSGSYPSAGKPVYWWPGNGACAAVAVIDPRCGSDSAVAQFRLWVRGLHDDDQDNLAKLGLDLQLLRAAAAQGQVFGFVANTFSREEILSLLSKLEVRTVQIVETWVEAEE